MKLLHLADLHLGKRVNGFSMLEDQSYILKQILKIIDEEKPAAVLIAGDVYDKSIPTEEAVSLLDDFLAALADKNVTVFLIAGNHDSAERLAFAGRLLGNSGIYVSPVYTGSVEPVILEDDYGQVIFWLLPFVKPLHVRKHCPDVEVKTYDDAVKAAISRMDVDETLRNVLLTHQFVAGSIRCDSEELSVGGTDQVDGAAFCAFDYVALGHLHGPQSIGRSTVRYAGSPLKYSFSEAGHQKSVTLVELAEKGKVQIREIALRPLREMAELQGTYDAVTMRTFYEDCGHKEDYVHITLLDETDIPDAAARLRVIYPNLMRLDYQKRNAVSDTDTSLSFAVEQSSPLDLFAAFFARQTGKHLSGEQQQLIEGLLEQDWEEGQ